MGVSVGVQFSQVLGCSKLHRKLQSGGTMSCAPWHDVPIERIHLARVRDLSRPNPLQWIAYDNPTMLVSTNAKHVRHVGSSSHCQGRANKNIKKTSAKYISLYIYNMCVCVFSRRILQKSQHGLVMPGCWWTFSRFRGPGVAAGNLATQNQHPNQSNMYVLYIYIHFWK
jgi:hypothetical protein